MRYLISLALWLFMPFFLFGQAKDSLNAELNKLNQQKNIIGLKIDSLEKEQVSINSRISELRTTLNKIELQNEKEEGIPTKISLIGGTLRDKPSPTGNALVELEEGDKILIYDWFQKPFFKASYEGTVGYIAYGSLKENKLVRQVKAKIDRKEFNKIEEENPKLARLIKKYGESTAKRLMNEELWIGMTDEMAEDALGIPDDINRTTTAYGVREQWVYPYGTYLYFEDGKLTSWQE